MSLPSKQIVLNTLNQTRHKTTPDTQLSLFQETPQIITPSDAEYWHYSDLHHLYGNQYFPIAPDMTVHAWRHLVMPAEKIKPKGRMPKLTGPTPQFFYEHVLDTTAPYSINQSAHKKIPGDLCMSRYACWCMARNNPDLIFAKTYFMAPAIDPNMSFGDMKKTTYKFARIDLRNQLSHYEKILAGILKQHGGDFSNFNHSMTMAFFYGYSANDIKAAYHIPEKTNDPLANYMGSASLCARITALKNAIRRFDSARHQNRETLYQILHDELLKQRIYVLKNFGYAPEQDIFQNPISTVQSELNRAERDFIYKYSRTKLR